MSHATGLDNQACRKMRKTSVAQRTAKNRPSDCYNDSLCLWLYGGIVTGMLSLPSRQHLLALWNLPALPGKGFPICDCPDSDLRSIPVPILNTHSSTTRPKDIASCPCLSCELLVPIKRSGERLSVMMAILPMPSDCGDDASENVPRRWLRCSAACASAPPTKNNTRNGYRGIHLVVAEGLGAAVSVTMISNLGRFVRLRK